MNRRDLIKFLEQHWESLSSVRPSTLESAFRELKAHKDEEKRQMLLRQREQEDAKLVEKIEKLIASHGRDSDEILKKYQDMVSRKKKGYTALNPPKFRHPDDETLVWSGRGRQPTWVKSLHDHGLKPVLIEQPDPDS